MALTPYPSQDYRFNPKGVYHNNPATPWNGHRKAKVNKTTDPKYGKVCLGCGVTRSRANKCECNSDS